MALCSLYRSSCYYCSFVCFYLPFSLLPSLSLNSPRRALGQISMSRMEQLPGPEGTVRGGDGTLDGHPGEGLGCAWASLLVERSFHLIPRIRAWTRNLSISFQPWIHDACTLFGAYFLYNNHPTGKTWFHIRRLFSLSPQLSETGHPVEAIIKYQAERQEDPNSPLFVEAEGGRDGVSVCWVAGHGWVSLRLANAQLCPPPPSLSPLRASVL